MRLTILFLVFSLSSLASCDNKNDFDLVCNYFDSMQKENAVNTLSPDEQYDFINNLIIKNLSANSPATVSFNAVIGYVPVKGRYALYVDAAETTLNKKWSCPSMKTLLQYF